MFIYKCDICKKEIKAKQPYFTVRASLQSLSLHEACAKPISAFLEKQKLLEEA